MTEGTVSRLNSASGLAAISVGGSFTIVESQDLALGDVLQWDKSRPLGSSPALNVTRGKHMKLQFENHDVSHDQVDFLLGLRQEEF